LWSITLGTGKGGEKPGMYYYKLNFSSLSALDILVLSWVYGADVSAISRGFIPYCAHCVDVHLV
jgi:hypothetical protein